MISSYSRFPGAALCAIALLPAMAGAETASAKIDQTLRESIRRGCAGTQSAIITVAPGYREALRQVLAVHGDVVHGEFPAIEAIAATVHCSDLATLAGFGSIRAVSTNATVGVNATNGFAREVEGRAARALKRTDFATLGMRRTTTTGGYGIGVAVIDSGIEPGPTSTTALPLFTISQTATSGPSRP